MMQQDKTVRTGICSGLLNVYVFV